MVLTKKLQKSQVLTKIIGIMQHLAGCNEQILQRAGHEIGKGAALHSRMDTNGNLGLLYLSWSPTRSAISFSEKILRLYVLCSLEGCAVVLEACIV